MTPKELTVAAPSFGSGTTPVQERPLPFVSVIVPCRNEEKQLAQCLDSILANDYPKDRMEILVVDGMSEDRTREIVNEYAERYPCVRLVENPEKHIPAAMNVGIRNGRGDSIIKMDAHSTYQSNHISLCVAYQEKYGAENVGGICRMSPGADTAVAQAIVLALAHRLGSGNAKVKVGVGEPTWADSAAFGCFKRECFSRVGLFDERLTRSSDMDMNMRIRAAGGRILLVPEIVINYCSDPDLKTFWKHNFADGLWATYVLKFGSKAWSWRHWIPLALVLSLLVSFTLSAVSLRFLWLGLGIVALYFAASMGASLQIAVRGKSAKQFFLLPIIFAIRHFAHGIGALVGLVRIIVPGPVQKASRGATA
jgi:glycosyltransferase involved in cell wall biosynthesis